MHLLSDFIQNVFKTKAMTFVMGVGLMFICSQLAIPLEPVPITLQTVGVMFIGLMYTPRMALAIIAGYLTMGALGFPVFSSYSGGLPILLGTRGGYLLGFLPTVYMMAVLREKYAKDSGWFFLGICTIGTIIYMGLGALWLSKFIGFEKAITLGVYPFILPGFLKAFILSGALYGVKKVKKSF